MPPAPLPPDEHDRLKALEELDILDTPPEEGFDRITRLACQLFRVPIAAVSLVDRDRQWFKSIQGLDTTQTPREMAFCGHTILGDGVLLTENAQCDERFKDNPLVTSSPSIRFYAGFPLRLPTGEKVGSFCVIDHQPRKLMPQEAALLRELAGVVVDALMHRQVAKLAVQAARAKAMFFAGIGHEIRTPMTAILGFSELLADPLCTDAERVDLIQTIHRNGRHLLGIIDNLLDFASIESGTLTLRPTTATVADTITDVVSTLTPRAAAKRVELGCSIDFDPALSATADHARIRQIVTNLVGNAITATDHGGVRVHGAIRRRDGNDLLVIEVADSGPGLADAELAGVFQHGNPGDQASSESGVALGLSLSRRLARLMGGEIAVESPAGRGTVFRLSVPLAPPAVFRLPIDTCVRAAS